MNESSFLTKYCIFFEQKPYVCNVPGCTKRYTDPSSLRKHVKTVHGAECYANKRHKATPSHPSSSDDGHGGTSNASGGFDSSPRSAEDMQSLNGGSPSPPVSSSHLRGPPVSSTHLQGPPASSAARIKSESDAHSPDQHTNSPVNRLSGMKQQPSNAMVSQMINESVSAIEDPAWPYEDEDLEVRTSHRMPAVSIHSILLTWHLSMLPVHRSPICRSFYVQLWD